MGELDVRVPFMTGCAGGGRREPCSPSSAPTSLAATSPRTFRRWRTGCRNRQISYSRRNRSSDAGWRCAALQADVHDTAQREDAVATVVETFGRIDILLAKYTTRSTLHLDSGAIALVP